jgi:hypothetical protein
MAMKASNLKRCGWLWRVLLHSISRLSFVLFLTQFLQGQEFLQRSVIESARMLDLRESKPYDTQNFMDLPESQDLVKGVEYDIKNNRGKETVAILQEWAPDGLSWQVATEVILFQMKGWPSYPIKKEDLGVMVDIFRASIRKNDKPINYNVPRGGHGSPFVFRSLYALRLAQAANPEPGYSPQNQHLWSDPLEWLESEVLAKTGELPSILPEIGRAATPEITAPRPRKNFPETEASRALESAGGESSEKGYLGVGIFTALLILAALVWIRGRRRRTAVG